MASINQLRLENTEKVHTEDSIDESDDDGSIVETLLETKLFRINCFMGTGKRLKVTSDRVYEWDEVVEVVTKFVEMIESYPGMIRSMEHDHMYRVWKKWISINYVELDSSDAHFMVMDSRWTQEETMQISFNQFHDMDDSAPPAFEDEISFHITKKSRMKSLKELGVEAVADNLKNVRDVEELKLPSSLAEELKQELNYFCEKFPVPTLKDLAAAAVIETLDKVEDVTKLDISMSLALKLYETGIGSKFPIDFLSEDFLNDGDSDDDEYFLHDESDEDSDSIYTFDPNLSSDGSYEDYSENIDSDFIKYMCNKIKENRHSPKE